jgi:hypothetical protein
VLTVEEPKKSRDRLTAFRERWRFSICYCSTLGDCWLANESGTHEVRRCAERNEDSFD